MEKKNTGNKLLLLVSIAGLLILLNQFQIMSLSNGSAQSDSKSVKLNVKLSGDTVQDAIKAVIPTGTPEYGTELGVTFGDPVNSLNVLNKLDSQIPIDSLSTDAKARYIAVASKISCEFCCGALSVIDKNGNAACGCSHSGSFRGLAKYLLKNHLDEWSDDEILMELTKWKAVFFPKNMVEKAVTALENGLDLTPEVLNDRNLLSKLKAGDTSSIGDLPEMVGGC